MFNSNGRESGLGHWKSDRGRYSLDSFQSRQRLDEYGDENGRGTWYQKRDSTSNTLADDAIEYPVSRVSGPLSPRSPNIEWNASGGVSPGRPQLVQFTKERKVNSQSSSGHGSGEVAFI